MEAYILTITYYLLSVRESRTITQVVASQCECEARKRELEQWRQVVGIMCSPANPRKP